MTELREIATACTNVPRGEGGAPACTNDLGQALEVAIPTKHHIGANLSSFVVKPAPGTTAESFNDSHKLLTGKNPYPPGTSIEYAVPIDHYIGALDGALKRMRTLFDIGACCVGPISVRFVQESRAFLAVTHGGERATIEILGAMGTSRKAMHGGERALDALGQHFMQPEFDARPHWGQRLPRLGSVVPRYPRYADWSAVREAVDPTRTFDTLPWSG